MLSDAGGNIAAVAAVINHRTVDAHLSEGVVHVGVVTGGRADDSQLARQRVRTGQTVDLADIGAAEDGEDGFITQGLVLGKIVFLDKNAFTGTRAHDHAGNPHLIAHI